MNYTYKFPRPSLTADCVIFGYDGNQMNLLLVKRNEMPFKGAWSLPGGFVGENEDAETAAKRVLFAKTGLERNFIEQLYTFSEPNRDPRGWVVSTAYFALINPQNILLEAGGNTDEVAWHVWSEIPDLAFDHHKILEMAVTRLKGKLAYQPIGFELLDTFFSLRQLQLLYETILETTIDKRNFRKKILKTNLLEEKKNQIKQSKNDPTLYRFDKTEYEILEKTGFQFSIL